MNIVAYALLVIFALVHLIPAVMAFKEHKIPLLNIGLSLLGALNILAGIILTTQEFELAIIAVISGVLSIDMGAILNGYWLNENGPNWTHHGVRAGISVFIVGLIALYG